MYFVSETAQVELKRGRVQVPGEGCDCGSSDCSATDPCCDGSSCQLAAGASCSVGASSADGTSGCCDAATCEAKAAVTIGAYTRPLFSST